MEDNLLRGAGRGAGFGAGRGGSVGVATEVDVEASGVEVEAGVFSAAAEEAGAAVLEGCSFLSSETFPMLMGNVNWTSGDFRLT